MNRILNYVTVVLAMLIICQCVAAASPDPLDGLLDRLGGYDYGKDSRCVNDLDVWMRGRLKDDIANAQVEQRLTGFLQTQASPAAKRYVCEHLSLIGTSASVGVLSEMLVEPATVECARYALERIPGLAASGALRAALAKTGGAAQIGIINSLGVRGDTGSIEALAELLKSDDNNVVSAAATALGKIGGIESLKILRAAMDSVDLSVIDDVMQACIASADRCDPIHDRRLLIGVYGAITQRANEGHIRIGALSGMADLIAGKMFMTILPMLIDDDVTVRSGTVMLIRDIGNKKLIGYAAERMGELDPVTQMQLLSVLGDCGGADEKPVVVAACRSDNSDVQAAALRALGKLGGAEDVMFLVRAAADRKGIAQEAARASLDQLHGAAVDDSIVSAIGKANTAEKMELLRSCAAREIKAAIPVVLDCARDYDGTVRIASLKLLRAICGVSELPALIDLLLAAEGGSEQREARKTIVAVARTITSPERRADAVVAKLKTLADTKGRCLLLGILGELGSTGGLDTLYASAREGDSDVRDASLRALSDWPTAAPADFLMTIVEQAGSTEKNKVLALRGYIRLAGLVSGDGDKALAMYQKAMTSASRIEEKRQVIAGLSNLKSVKALSMAEGFVSDSSLKAETGAAVLSLSDQLDEAHPFEVKEALEALLAANDDPEVRNQAEALLDFGYITDWDTAGPYATAGKTVKELIDEVFDPEKAGPSKTQWKRLAAPIEPLRFWEVDLDKAVGCEGCVVYLRTRLLSERDRRTYLYFGCTGDYKVFLNGDLYGQGADNTPCFPGEHAIRVETHNGWNDLVVKIAHDSGEWAFCGRIRGDEGEMDPGIIVKRAGN